MGLLRNLFGKRLRVLVTRPEQDAKRLTELLKERQIDVIAEPLLTIQPQSGAKPRVMAEVLRRPQAVIITSSNGIRALASFTEERTVPIITVGEISAQEATQLGFTNVRSGGGDTHALVKFIHSNCDAKGSFLLHIAGSVVAGNLIDDIEEMGFDIRRVTAYKAVAATRFSENTISSIVNCELDVVMFYSPRTARIFEKLIREARLDYLMKHVTMIAISKNVVSDLPWRAVHIATEPSTESMLALIDRLRSDNVDPGKPI